MYLIKAFSLLFIIYIKLFSVSAKCTDDCLTTIPYKWTWLNFTFESVEMYEDYVEQGEYLPVNNFLSGIKIYKNQIYLALPRYREGTPATLVTIPQGSPEINPLLQPYPDWESNVGPDCASLQNVQSMEIDNDGIMWVIDGVRINDVGENCPPKLVLLDLNNDGSVVHTFTFPEEISSRDSGFLNDLVLDDGFAFISDSSRAYPGLIVYSREEDRAWKLYDDTMLPEDDAVNFTLNGDYIDFWGMGIDAIALSPISLPEEERYVFYSPFNAYELYAIPLTVLKNISLYDDCDDWKDYVENIGSKQGGQSSGMVMDNKNRLWYSLVTWHGIAMWKVGQDFDLSNIIYRNEESAVWPDVFAFDDNGYLYFTSNKYAYKIVDPSETPCINPTEYVYFITRRYVDANSYLYIN